MSDNSDEVYIPEDYTPAALEARRLKGESLDLEQICYHGITRNDKTIMQYIHDKLGYKFTDQTFQFCLTSGPADLEMIKYIRSAGWEWNGDAVEFSTIEVPILKWLIENGCPHDPHRVVMSSIVWKFGNKDALIYLHEELGYKLTEQHLKAAQGFNRTWAVEYIKDRTSLMQIEEFKKICVQKVNGAELFYRDPFNCSAEHETQTDPNTLPQLTFPPPDWSDTTKAVIAAVGYNN